MPNIPWRITAQTVNISTPDGEPMFRLDFGGSLNSGERQTLRIVPADDPKAPAIELEFQTGGGPLGPAHFQDRWLRPFERPDLGNPNIRRNVEFRKAAWDAGQGGSEAPSEREFYDRWDEEHTEEVKDAEGNVIGRKPKEADVHPTPTPEAIEAAEKKSADVLAQQRMARDARLAAGLPVDPWPHTEPGVATASPQPTSRPDEGKPEYREPGELARSDTPDPVRANQAGHTTDYERQGTTEPRSGPDPVPPKGVTTTQNLKPQAPPTSGTKPAVDKAK